MQLRIFVSRHSAFYSPIIATVAAGFLKAEGIDATYGILGPGQTSSGMIREGKAHIIQSSVSSNWGPIERGERHLPVHFAQINQRDGFFLAARKGEPFAQPFDWRSLEGRTLLADFAGQPLVMLKYAVHYNHADFTKIHAIDRGAPEKMIEAFRAGEGDFIHLQSPAPHQLAEDGIAEVAVSVGASMPETAFSSLCCSHEFTHKPEYKTFLRAYTKSREWVRSADPREIAEKESYLFPGVTKTALAAAIAAYQTVGNWNGGIEITKELYNQTWAVFEMSGAVKKHIPWEQVCKV